MEMAHANVKSLILFRLCQGVSQKDALCATCNQGLNECVGHFGYLDLALPVYHVGHFRATIQILQSICKVSAIFFLSFSIFSIHKSK